MRSSISRDYPLIYVYFDENSFNKTNVIAKKYPWLRFDPNEKITNYFKPIPALSEENIHYGSSVSIGSKMYFVGGYPPNYSWDLWIFNSLSGELCKGPNMKVCRTLPGVAVVDGKLYVMGGCREQNIQMEIFDTKTQTWEVGPLNLHGEIDFRFVAMEAVSVEEKVYGITFCCKKAIVYDTKDCRYETIEMPIDPVERREVCVIDNVMYVYYIHHGLMWYDSKDKLWRMVQGLDMLIKQSVEVVMVECKGKLGFFWERLRNHNDRPIWCTMIVLDRSGVEVHGTIEWSVVVGYVPQSHSYPPWRSSLQWRCLSFSD